MFPTAAQACISMTPPKSWQIRMARSFQYLSKSDKNAEDELIEYENTNYPTDMQKKFTLLMHFRKHLTLEEKVDDVETPLTHVKKWLTTSHAMIFRLSNKIVQVYFQDKSELMLCSDTKQVVYVNKHGEIVVHPLATAMESNNKELTKRLKYTREILTTMLQPPGSTKSNSPRNE